MGCEVGVSDGCALGTGVVGTCEGECDSPSNVGEDDTGALVGVDV